MIYQLFLYLLCVYVQYNRMRFVRNAPICAGDKTTKFVSGLFCQELNLASTWPKTIQPLTCTYNQGSCLQPVTGNFYRLWQPKVTAQAKKKKCFKIHVNTHSSMGHTLWHAWPTITSQKAGFLGSQQPANASFLDPAGGCTVAQTPGAIGYPLSVKNYLL